MNRLRLLRWSLSLILCLGVLSWYAVPAGVAWAQDDTAVVDETAEPVAEEASGEVAPAAPDAEVTEETAEVVEESAEPAAATAEQEYNYTVNTLIMFLAAVLVIFMQPGFAILEVGLNSAKNAVNIMFKNVMDLCIGVLLFFFIGFALMFPGDDYAGKWFGFGHSGISGYSYDAGDGKKVDATQPYSPNAFFLFQVAFAATAATIVSGAVAGRMKFPAYLVYSAVITGLVYPISGMWVWGGGWLAAQGYHDFAGSTVVHAVGGFAGLAGAILLGPRIGRFAKDKAIPMPGHNLTFAGLGVFILWVGWYGFNPGSQLTYAGAVNANITAYIAVTTTLAAAAGATAAMIIAWCLFGKPDMTMALNGALAGLVAITANCDCVPLWASIVIGVVGGLLVVIGIMVLDKLHIDDPVGAWPVHGLCGIWGGIATGVFGVGQSLTTQVIGSLLIGAWAFGTMLVLFAALKAIGILRVSPEDESEGLDKSEHGMHAYPPHLIVDEKYSPVPHAATSA